MKKKSMGERTDKKWKGLEGEIKFDPDFWQTLA